jgi:hypothetical protein
MNDQLEMFTTTLGLAGQKTQLALNHPSVAIAHNAPDTSREVVHFWIKWAGRTEAKGMTADEISVLLELPAQSVSARINGLHRDAYIVDSGMRRKTRYGRNAIVWVAC